MKNLFKEHFFIIWVCVGLMMAIQIIENSRIKKGDGVLMIAKPVYEKEVRDTAIYHGNATDTLSRLRTAIFYPSKIKSVILEIYIITDSLSGCTNGKLSIQNSVDGDLWLTSEERQINGWGRHDFIIYNRLGKNQKIRIIATAPYSTQKTKVSVQWGFKSTNPKLPK